MTITITLIECHAVIESPTINCWWFYHGVALTFSWWTLQWRHNERDGVSNHQPHDCLLNGLFRRRSKKTSKLRVTGLCAGKSPVTGEFPAQRASIAKNVSIWWRHHANLAHLSKTPHGCLVSADIIVWLPQCQWSSPKGLLEKRHISIHNKKLSSREREHTS